MFNGKRIKAMEQEIAQLKEQLRYLTNSNKELVAFRAAVSLDGELVEDYLEGKTGEDTLEFLRYKYRYESGLRRFVRNTISKKKTNVLAHGKEKSTDKK